MSRKLTQIIAAEAAVKGTAQKRITELHKENQNAALFEGLQKAYKPLSDTDDERLASEGKRVQLRVDEQIGKAVAAWDEWLSLALTKDDANTAARGTVTVRGQTLLENAPVTFLLFLEKRLLDVQSFVAQLPVLDEAHSWKPDTQGLYRSDIVRTHRTKKTQRAIVLYDATPEHPAQTQLITEDIVSGHYETERTSGAVSHVQKRDMLQRVHELILAVKEAREQANIVDAPTMSATRVLEFVFNGSGT